MARAQGAVVDVRELSFQNVVDQILKPNGVKVGGFPDDIFVDLTDEEQTDFICNICYMILNEPRQCDNKHLFCETCIFAWSMTYGENSQKCPVCRCDQKSYGVNATVRRQLWDKKIKCPVEKCDHTASLRAFLMHSHGKERFSNEHVDLESLRPPRPEGARLLVLPNIHIQGNTRMERVASIRDQIHQGRMMIHQMMLLLHLEMQLRQQALISYSQATDPVDRLQRLDEVMALNEQLNEVGGVLSSLLNSPISNVLSAARSTQSRGAAEGGGTSTARRSGLSDILRSAGDQSDLSDTDSDSSISLDESQPRRSGAFVLDYSTSGSRSQPTRRIDLSHGPPAEVTSPGPGIGSMSQFERRARERERSALIALGGNVEDNESIPDIPQGRHLSDLSQAGAPMTEIHPRVLLGGSTNPGQNARETRNNTTVQETTRALNASNTRVTSVNTTSGTRSSTTALPSINSTNSTTVANSVARMSTPSNLSQTRQHGTNPTASEVGMETTGGSVSTATVPQRLLSGRTRAQAPTLSGATTTAEPNTHTSITYQSSVNAGNNATPRPPAPNVTSRPSDSSTRPGPAVEPLFEPEEPAMTQSTTPRFEQRHAFRASQSSSTTPSRASSASRRSSVNTSPARDTVARQPRYAPRLRQETQIASRNTRPNISQRANEQNSSQSPDRNNNRTGLSRPRDISNRLANASYRRSMPNTRTFENDNNQNNDSDASVPKPPPRRRSTVSNNSTVPRGLGTSGQLLRARRRSEIQQELMKSRENRN